MDISLILKLAGLGILVAIATQILNKSGRDEQALFVTLAGIIAALMLLVGEIRNLFDLVTSTFGI
jgi:stage III sporulation protein AC